MKRTFSERVDDELRLARIRLMRALRAEGKARGVYGRIFEFADIVDELLSHIELLELARLALRMSRRLASSSNVQSELNL